jgi:RNA polymerase sigma-70 factor (ECF subfamily)
MDDTDRVRQFLGFGPSYRTAWHWTDEVIAVCLFYVRGWSPQRSQKLRPEELEELHIGEEELFREFVSPLLRKTLSILKDEADAWDATIVAIDDAVHFLSRHTSEEKRLDHRELFSYAYQSAVHRAYDILRKRKRQRGLLEKLTYLFREQGSEEDPADSASRIEEQSLIRESVNRLPKELHEVQVRAMVGMTHSQIAEELKIPLGTVSTRIRRAHKILKGSLYGIASIDPYSSDGVE